MPLHHDAARQAELWDRWGEEHSQLYADRDPAAAVSFLCELAGNGSALDLGAGTGRVAAPLAGAGVPVVALDVSPVLVRRLRASTAGLPVTVVEADMAEYCNGSFTLIYAAHSSFFHITDQKRQVACMANVARMLAPGGAFVLSCFMPSPELLAHPNGLTLRGLTDESVEIRATTVDRITQTIVYREMSVRAGGIRTLPVEQRFCWPSELDLMAQLGGMSLSGRFSDFALSPFRSSDDRHVSVYRKTEDDGSARRPSRPVQPS